MACIFKRGGKKKAGPWYIAYSERPGARRFVRGCRDRKATEAMAHKLEDDARLRLKGLSDLKTEAFAAAEAKPLDEHLDDFEAWLTGKGVTKGHVATVRARALRIIKLAHASRISELSLSRAQDALRELRSEGRSLQTLTHYVRSIKEFSRWLVKDGRARDDGLAHLAGFNARTDRRRVRRILGDEELRKLIDAARNGETIGDITGPDRAILYQVALCTGFRRSELGSLVPESFDLDTLPPMITVRAAYSKRRREDRQPIPPALADVLRPWLRKKAPGESVFRLPYCTAAMLRKDLASAGILDEDGDGVVDLHAMRHIYISKLALSGIPVKVAQELARHSTPVLTMNTYAHVDEAVKAAAVAFLPVAGTQSAALAALSRCPGRTTPGTTLRVPRIARGGITGHQEGLDGDRLEVVSSKALSNARRGVAQLVGRDGVWWPHWSSKPVAGR